VRGPGGGYQINPERDSIAVASVIDAVDESIDATRCGGKGNCQNGETCLTHYLWSDLSDQIHQFLSNITLDDLVERENIRQVATRQHANMNSHCPALERVPISSE
jgi:Rrf2 family iron-sulfur cluster assembly transcriptional regulator